MSGNATLQLTPSLEAPRTAREFVQEMAVGAGLGRMASTLVLLASELVTNAVVHGRGPMRIKMYVREREVVVEVSDAGAGVPEQRQPAELDATGRGLLVVSGLAQAWGVEPHGGGKTVWCSLSR